MVKARSLKVDFVEYKEGRLCIRNDLFHLPGFTLDAREKYLINKILNAADNKIITKTSEGLQDIYFIESGVSQLLMKGVEK